MKFYIYIGWNEISYFSFLRKECLSFARSPCFRAVKYSRARDWMHSHALRRLVDDKSVASCQQTCCKLIVKIRYPQACCKLFQQVVTSLQTTSCNKPDFNSIVVTWWNWQACCNLLISWNKPVNWQLATGLLRFWQCRKSLVYHAISHTSSLLQEIDYHLST